MKKKINIYLLISFITGLIYFIYLIFHFFGGIAGTSGAEQLGVGLATALVLPHILLTLVGVVFNGIALFTHNKWFALTGAIGYSIALLLFPLYFLFVSLEIILSYIGFAQLLKNKSIKYEYTEVAESSTSRSKGMDITLNIIIVVSILIIIYILYLANFA